MMLHTYNPQCSYQVTTSYTLRFLTYSTNKILEVKVTTTRSNQDYTMTLHNCQLQPPTNVPTKYQLLTPYSTKDIAQTRFLNSRSPSQGQIKVTP